MNAILHLLRFPLVFAAVTLAVSPAAPAQDPNSSDGADAAATEIDACGTLVRGVTCVMFETGGKQYYLADYGGFDIGDEVRVVGTLDPSCITICLQGDGCIRGATVYDPRVFPCGTDLPNFPADICSEAASAALSGLAAAGLWLARRPRTPRVR